MHGIQIMRTLFGQPDAETILASFPGDEGSATDFISSLLYFFQSLEVYSDIPRIKIISRTNLLTASCHDAVMNIDEFS